MRQYVRVRLLLSSMLLLGLGLGSCASQNETPSAADAAASKAASLASLKLQAEQGNAAAQLQLGQMYENGAGVQQSYTESVKWFRSAAEQGLELAQNKLGIMYQEGLGVPRDYAKAYMWHYLVATADAAVDTMRARMARTNSQTYEYALAKWLSPAQIDDAKERARKCQLNQFKQCDESVIAGMSAASGQKTVLLRQDGGTYVVPVMINGIMTLRFTVDSGATDVSIPADVFSDLRKAGTIADTDLLAKKTYVLADGSKISSQTFRIRSLKVGDFVMENVTGSVAPIKGDPLLGQSFLGRLRSWSMDNQTHALTLE